MFNRIKRLFGFGNSDAPYARWLDADESPFGVPVIDIKRYTLGVVAASTERWMAENAVSFFQEDGLVFVGTEPKRQRRTALDLSYPIDGHLYGGMLFSPQEMEHKWAMYFHSGEMIFVFSWTREVVAVAETEQSDGFLRLTALRGELTTEEADDAYIRRQVEFLIHSHALDIPFPAPISEKLAMSPEKAAERCFAWYGNRALYATPHANPRRPIEKPLRTHSLLHIAVARNDLEGVEAQLAAGTPIDLLAGDGLTPMHWSFAAGSDAPMLLLLDRGANVDARSAEGATPLMNAVQSKSFDAVALLLDHGADVNATDDRGFTSLHRAAERGLVEILRLLLERGADAKIRSGEHTASSFAAGRGHQEVVALLEKHGG